MIQVIGYILVGLTCIAVFLVMVYVTAGIQMRSWLDVFDKYFSDKFNKK